MFTNNYINIWLDDIRPAPRGWLWAKTVEEFVYLYFYNYVRLNMISLDHDLGTEETGYDAVKIITGWHEFLLPRKIFLHTSNPVGRENMYSLLLSFAKHTDSSCEILSGPNAEAWDESMRLFNEEDSAHNTVNYMNIKEFREEGFLQEANRQFFHPLGLALEVGIDESGDEFISGVWDYRDDPEGMSYWMKDIEQAEKKMKYVQELFDSKAELRTQLFGDPVQSVKQMKR